MAYDDRVADRIRRHFGDRADVVEKRMFGGIAFMVNGHMCVGVNDDRLMARVGPEQYDEALALPHAGEMDFTGKPLKGFVYVAPEGFATAKALARWIERCERFVNALPPK